MNLATAAPASHDRYQQRRVLVQRPLIWRYEAYDRILERKVLLHELNPALAGDQALRSRFLEAVGALVSLEHPQLGRILSLNDAGPSPSLVQEFAEGIPLAAMGLVPTQTALELMVQLAELLIFLHQQHIPHLPLSPKDIVVTPEGRVVVVDTGMLALALAGPDPAGKLHAVFVPGQPLGTPATPATDVYTLGALLRDLTGATAGTMERRAGRPKGLPVQRLCDQAQQEDPAQRPTLVAFQATMQDLLAASSRSTMVSRPALPKATVPLQSEAPQAAPPVTPAHEAGAQQRRPTVGTASAAVPQPVERLSTHGASPAGQRQRLLKLLIPLLGVVVLGAIIMLVVRPGAAEQAPPLASGPLATVAPTATTASVEEPAPGSELTGPVLLADDFEQQRWASERTSRWANTYRNGRYWLWMKAGVGAVWSTAPDPLPAGPVAITVEVETRQGGGGILFGFVDPNNYYRLQSGVNGGYRLEQRVQGRIQTLATGTGAGQGQLGLVLADREVRVYFDGELLSEHTLDKAPQGVYGLMASGARGAEAFFDQLTIRALP